MIWGNTRRERVQQWVLQCLFGWTSPSFGRVTFREAWTGECRPRTVDEIIRAALMVHRARTPREPRPFPTDPRD